MDFSDHRCKQINHCRDGKSVEVEKWQNILETLLENFLRHARMQMQFNLSASLKSKQILKVNNTLVCQPRSGKRLCMKLTVHYFFTNPTVLHKASQCLVCQRIVLAETLAYRMHLHSTQKLFYFSESSPNEWNVVQMCWKCLLLAPIVKICFQNVCHSKNCLSLRPSATTMKNLQLLKASSAARV